MRFGPIKNKKGFTLIEVLVVVVILGILITTGTLITSSNIHNGRVSSTTNSLQTFAADTEQILAEYGVLKITEGDTRAQVIEYLDHIERFYVHTYFDRSSLVIKEGYFEILTSTLVDGWESPFKLKYCFQEENAGVCMLASPGPDMVFKEAYTAEDFGDDIILFVYPKLI